MKKIEKEFEQIRVFIASSRNRAAGFMNYAAVATYWTIGAYVSIRLASRDWGVKSVEQLCDYLKTREPKLRGFGQRQIYNMIEFFKAYSSAEFAEMFARLKLDEFVQSLTAKLPGDSDLHLPNAKSFSAAVLHLPNAKCDEIWSQIPSGELLRGSFLL